MTVHIIIASGEMDPECMRCGACIDARGVLLIDEDDSMCQGCVPPAVARVAEALQTVYDALALDGLSPDELTAIGSGLNVLGRVAGRLASGEASVQKRVNIASAPWEPGVPVGVQVDWQIVNGLG
ncbi:hypothetical protein [Actinomadura sp. 9N215]|uniref:hypothetical protein n=1 Tax=Actinomadura sp. 9N215 TaxID=3375150 RepID=UPI0037B5DA3F